MNPQTKSAGNLGISPKLKKVSFEVPEVPKVNSGLGVDNIVGEEAVEPWVAKHGVRPSEDEVESIGQHAISPIEIGALNAIWVGEKKISIREMTRERERFL